VHGDRGGTTKKRKVPPTPKPTAAQQDAAIFSAKMTQVKPWQVRPPAPPPRPRRQVVSPQPKPSFRSAISPPLTSWGARSPATIPFRTGTILPTTPDIPYPTTAQRQRTRTQQRRDDLYKASQKSVISQQAQQKLASNMSNQEKDLYQRLHPTTLGPHQRIIHGRLVQMSVATPPLKSLAETGRVGAGINRLISGIPSSIGALGTAVGEDVYDQYRNAYDLAHGNQIPADRRTWHLHTADVLKDIGVGTAQGLMTDVGINSRKGWEALLRGDMTTFTHEQRKAKQRAQQALIQDPVGWTVNVGAAVAAPLRLGSISALSKDIMEANPGMGIVRATRLARHESYRPGYLAAHGIEGGMDPRTLTADVEGGGTITTPAANPLATTPLGRAAQRVYDAHTARIDPNTRIIGRWSEQNRAVRAIEKQQTASVERAQLAVNQIAQEVGKYVRGTRRERLAAVIGRRTEADLGKQKARAAGLVYALQGPAGETARATLRATREDLQQILDEGGREIPTKARIRVERQMGVLDQELQKMGLGIDETAPGWTEMRNMLHGAGASAVQVENQMQLMKQAARVWAKGKLGRDPSDFLMAPDGANVGAFLNSLPKDGVANVLFQQRAGWNTNLVRASAKPPVQPGDILYDTDGEPLVVLAKNENGDVQVQHWEQMTSNQPVVPQVVQDATGRVQAIPPYGRTRTIPAEQVGLLQHQSLQPGQRIALSGSDSNALGEVVAVNPEAQVVDVKLDNGGTTYWNINQIAQPAADAPFYHPAAQALVEKMPNQATPDQIIGILKNAPGVKKDALEMSGLNDWLEVMQSIETEGGKPIKLSKQEVLDWIDNRSPFNINELHLTRARSHGAGGARWGYGGFTTRPDSPDYHEMVIVLGGKKTFQYGTHWSGIDNPIVHIRYIIDRETNTLYINEIQSDWNAHVRDHVKSGGKLLPKGVTTAEWEGRIRDAYANATQARKYALDRSMKLLGAEDQSLDYGTFGYQDGPASTLKQKLNLDAREAATRIADAKVEEQRPMSYSDEQTLRRQEYQRQLDLLHETPEWKQLEKIVLIEAKGLNRANRWVNEAQTMERAVASNPYPGTQWIQLALKRAVAQAVHEGLDKVAWDAGIVHAVRYQHYDPRPYGEDSYDSYDYGDDVIEPDSDSYTQAYNEVVRNFQPPQWPQGIGLETRSPIDSGLMDKAYKLDDVTGDYGEPTFGEAFVADHGPLEGQLVVVTEVNPAANEVILRPSGVTQIHFQGTSDGYDSYYGSIERTITHQTHPMESPQRRYDSFDGRIDKPADSALAETGISDRNDFHWDLNNEADRAINWELDQEAFDEAYNEYQSQLEERQRQNEEIHPDEINHVDASHETGLVGLYDEIVPKEAKALFKKHGVEVSEGTRRGQFTIEGSDWRSQEGGIKVHEFTITPQLKKAAQEGQALFQQAGGVPVGATWTMEDGRRAVALLQNADVSTFLHEMIGHGVNELSQRFPQEWAGVETAMKKPLDQWTTVEHEKFAKWVERYFREGKAPTPETVPLLAQLKTWMRQIYQSITEISKRPIPQEARDLLDRYLGKEGEGSVFSAGEQAILKEHGALHERRQQLIKAEQDRLAAQPDAALLDQAQTLMADGTPAEQKAAYQEIAKRRRGAEGEGLPSENQRLLQRQVRMLDDAIREASDPKSGFDSALAALVTLSEHADQLFRDTILDMAPEDAKAGIEAALEKRRNILVNRWREQGLLPYGTGDALGYFPHASLFESLGDQLKGPVRQPAGSRKVVGATQVSKIAARKGENLLRRYQSGRLNLDPKVLLNTVNARLRLLQTREARDGLWAVGKPVASEKDVPQGWWVINREGKHVPERLRRAQELSPQQMDEMVAAGEDFDSNVETRQGMDNFLTDYASSFARPADQVPEEWWKAGELRAVPPEIVDGLLPKPFQGKPGGAFGSAVGIANSGARAATILGYPAGYVLSNVPANLLLQGLTHPSALVRDNFRALALRKRDPNLYHQLAQVAGDIMAQAGIPDFYPRPQGGMEGAERRIAGTTRRVAQAYGEVADTPFRVGTLMGYARRYGIKSDEDLAKLVKGEGNMGALRDTLGQKTRDDLLDFNTLSQREKETVARFFFLWPLVRAMVKWPITFARDHPIALAAIQQAGQPDFEKKYGYARLGTTGHRALRHLSLVPTGGGKAIDTSSENPMGGLQTVMSLLNAAPSLSRGDLGMLRDAIAGMTIPQVNELLQGQPTMQGLIEATIPGAKYLTSSLGKSRGSKIWKREDWWNYMLSRNVRFDPEHVDAAMVRAQADKEQRQIMGTTAAQEKADAIYKALPKILAGAGVTNPDDIKAVYNGFEAYDYVSSRIRTMSNPERVKLVNDAIRQYYPQYAGDLTPADQMTPQQQQDYINRVRGVLYDVHRRVIVSGHDQGLIP